MRDNTFKIYDRLRSEMRCKKITQKEIGEFLGVHQTRISKQLMGYDSSSGCKAYFSLEQAIKIQERYFPGLTVNELFATREYSLKRGDM